MMKLFPSQKDAAKQMILLPSKIHQFKASYFLGIAGAWLSRCAGTTPPGTAAAAPWAGSGHCSQQVPACLHGEIQPTGSTNLYKCGE